MAELTTLARPYAKAAFEYAHSAKVLEQWSASLSTLATVVANQSVSKLLSSPEKTAEQKSHLLTEICGDEIDSKSTAFIKVLAENNRLGLLPTIYNQYEVLKSRQQKFSEVEVTSAFALSDDTETAITDKLKTMLNNDVSLSTKIDKSILGGVIVRAGDTVIDGSVKGRLRKLAENLGV
ncbi:MAG: F0F1 ATP synthase subunit delta [Pseudomonadota bacterium]